MRKFGRKSKLEISEAIPCTLCSRPSCWYFCWCRGANVHGELRYSSTEKQLDKHRQAAARPFAQWADEWLAKKKVEKVKRGRIVAVRDPKTVEVLELRVGYVKARFGKLCRQDIKRPDVLAFIRS